MITSQSSVNVLLALDGSEKDERTLAVGLALAEVADANLHVVRVFKAALEADLAAGAATYGIANAGPILRDSIDQSVQDAADRLTARASRPVTSAVIDGRDAAGALLKEADGRDVRAIVMATRAPGMIGRAFLGSVADAVVRGSTRPVLLAPPGTHGRKHGEFRRALVPVDGSQDAMAVVPHLAALSLARQIELVLIRVAAPDLMHASARQARHELSHAGDRLRHQFAGVEFHVLESTEPAPVIVNSIDTLKVDFIAMTTHGEGGLARMFLGSVATGVVQQSEVPVLLVTRSNA